MRTLRSTSVIGAVLFVSIAGIAVAPGPGTVTPGKPGVHDTTIAPESAAHVAAVHDRPAVDTKPLDTRPLATRPLDTSAFRTVAAGGLASERVRRSGRDGGSTTAAIAMHPATVIPPVRPESARSETSARRARAELQRLEVLLANPYAAALTPVLARATRAGIDTLLPLLRSREDSVEAWYHAAELDLVLTADSSESVARRADACRLMTTIKEPARTTRFDRRVQRLLEQLRCD